MKNYMDITVTYDLEWDVSRCQCPEGAECVCDPGTVTATYHLPHHSGDGWGDVWIEWMLDGAAIHQADLVKALGSDSDSIMEAIDDQAIEQIAYEMDRYSDYKVKSRDVRRMREDGLRREWSDANPWRPVSVAA